MGEERKARSERGATMPVLLCAYKCLALVWVPQAALMRGGGGGRGVVKTLLRLQQRRFPSVSSFLPLSTSSVSWCLSKLGSERQCTSMDGGEISVRPDQVLSLRGKSFVLVSPPLFSTCPQVLFGQKKRGGEGMLWVPAHPVSHFLMR